MIYLQYIKNFGGKVETLYDILEVSRKASKEVIEKAYKTLAKKYHPDLQTAENKYHSLSAMERTDTHFPAILSWCSMQSRQSADGLHIFPASA